jgi:hypothetical protein
MSMKKLVMIAAATLVVGFSSGYWLGRFSVELTSFAQTGPSKLHSEPNNSLTQDSETQITGSIVPSELIDNNNTPKTNPLISSAQSIALDALNVPPSLQNTLIAAHLLGLDDGRATQLLALESEREKQAFKRMQGHVDSSENPDSTTEAIAELLSPEQFEQYQTQLGRTTAVKVPSVVPQSQAEREGLKAGDKIIRYNNSRIYSVEGLKFAIKNTPPDEVVEVIYMRDGQRFSAYVSSGPIGIGSHTNQSFLLF